MSDIRNYFQPKSQPAAKPKNDKPSVKRSRKIDDSDDDEKPLPKKTNSQKDKAPSPENEPMDDIEVSDYFGGKPSAKKPPKKSAKTKEELPEKKSAKKPAPKRELETASEETTTPKPSPKKTKSEAPKKQAAPKKSPQKKPTVSEGGSSDASDILSKIPDAILPDVDTSKKFNYRDFMSHRDDASNTDENYLEIPEAADNCLAGLVFVFTGVLPQLSREKGQELVKKYGGKVTSSPSRNTSVVVLGADAGPKKIETIKKLGIKAVDQNGFLELLKSMPPNGGSGANAMKAMEKKAKEEKKAQEDAEALNAQFEKEKKNRSKAANHEQNTPFKPEESQLWADKYAPTDISMLCGNKTSVERLTRWLSDWKINAKSNFKNPGRDGSGIYRAAILHGPPGIGKTTSAHLIAEKLGFDVIENNASDVRSKSLVMNGIGNSLDNTSLEGFFMKKDGPQKSKKNHCFIFDEVDGMSAGDRGGVGAMASLCRTTGVPIILICNERTLPKMRPFDRVTYDIPFRRPDANAIRSRMMTIAHRENLHVSANVIDQLVESTRSDIRQILNLLSSYALTEKSMDYDKTKEMSSKAEKNVLLRPFDIVGRYLSGNMWAPSNPATLNDKMELYFHDHDFAPLMVQENYLNTNPAKAGSTKGGHLELVARAAESISDSDLVDACIHGQQQQWNLMPFHAVMSCVRPSFFIAGQGRGRFNFTSLLGNISKSGKYRRQLQELQSHMRLVISGDNSEVRLQYMSLLGEELLEPLLKEGSDGIDKVMSIMDSYFLTKDDWDVIMDLSVGSNNVGERAKKITTQTKSAFTRKYNATDHPLPFIRSSAGSLVMGSTRKEVPDLEDVIEEDQEAEEPETKDDDDQDLTKDKYIKVAKTKGAAKKKPATKGKAKASK